MANGRVREKAGKLYVVLALPDGHGGKKEKWISVEKECGKNAGPRAAQKLLRDKLQELDKLGVIVDTRLTVEAFLRDWLDVKQGNIAISTYASYDTHIRTHILPGLGPILLKDLTVVRVQKYFSDLIKSGKSPRQVQYIRSILRQALGQAVKWDMIPRNPAIDVDIPAYRTPEKRIWTDEETERFIGAIQGHPLELAFLLYIATGCRRGEVLGLTWERVDYKAGGIHVAQSLTPDGSLSATKTESSIRFILLSGAIMERLQAHQEYQQELVKRGAFNNPHNAVFLTSNGTLYLPGNVLRAFKQLCDAAQVPRINIHALRHLQASWLIADGIDIKTVQNRLGHSRAQTTLDVYAQLLQRQQEQAADSIDRRMGNRDKNVIRLDSYRK
jgi:integrase